MLYSIPFYTGLIGRILFDEEKAGHSHVLIYGAVSQHARGELGCIASNAKIAEETGLEASTVSKCLSQMNKAGWIEVILKNGQRKGIIPLIEISIPQKKNRDPLLQGKPTPYSRVSPPLLQGKHKMQLSSSISNSLDEPEYSSSNQKKEEEIHQPEYYLESKQPHIRLLGYYFKRKEIIFENVEQQRLIFKMNIPWAAKITKARFSRDKILEAFDRAEKIPGKADYNLSTVLKYLTK